MPALSIHHEKPRDIEYNNYLKSASWQCSEGGAHFWIHAHGKTWHCQKCGQPREFHCPDYAWNDRMDASVVFGVSGLFDVMQRSSL